MTFHYLAHVALHQITGNKLACDLAHLLGHPLFSIDPKDGPHGVAKTRQKVFDFFCRVCLDAGVPVPPLETALIDCHLFQHVRDQDAVKSQTLVAQIGQRLEPGKPWQAPEAAMCEAAAIMLTIFPHICGSFGHIDAKVLTALVNRCFLKMGLLPIRPDYASMILPNAWRVPPRPVKVLVVDDSVEEILKTMVMLAGWPGVYGHWLHHQPASGKDTELLVTELAQAIISDFSGPHNIVFMDQSLGGEVKGDKVIARIRSLFSVSGYPLFIANMGGSNADLRQAGCVASAVKGESITEAMQIAFQHLPLEV